MFEFFFGNNPKVYGKIQFYQGHLGDTNSQEVTSAGSAEQQSTADELWMSFGSICPLRWLIAPRTQDTVMFFNVWRNIRPHFTVNTCYYLCHLHACSLLANRAACWMSHYLLELLLFASFFMWIMRICVSSGCYCKTFTQCEFCVCCECVHVCASLCLLYVHTL